MARSEDQDGDTIRVHAWLIGIESGWDQNDICAADDDDSVFTNPRNPEMMSLTVFVGILPIFFSGERGKCTHSTLYNFNLLLFWFGHEM